jgi:hypothetical protein
VRTLSCRCLQSHSGMMLSNASNSSATEEIIKIGTYKLKNDEYFKVSKQESQILLQKSF